MTRSSLRAAAVGMGLTLASSCQSGGSPTGSRPAPAEGARPTFVHAPSHGASVAEFVATEVRRGRADHFGVLVYVGAKWCEPCQRFHRAVDAGQLDSLLSGMHLVEFDLDEDRTALERAGYRSELIPLFAVPREDGTASELRMEGSIKGEAAVDQNLSPRLRALLSRAHHI